jgi:hypothetical protein
MQATLDSRADDEERRGWRGRWQIRNPMPEAGLGAGRRSILANACMRPVGRKRASVFA